MQVAYAQNFESYFGANETHVVQINNNYTLGMFPLSIDSLAITSEVTATDNTVLKKVEHYNNYTQPNTPSNTFYLREDTSEGKLWIRSQLDGNEFLISDMTLDVGDTTNIFSPYSVNTVTSIEYINGKKHIYFDNQYFLNLIPGLVNSNKDLFFKEGVIPFMVAEPITQGTQGSYFVGESATVCVVKDSNHVFTADDIWEINLGPYDPDWIKCELFDIYNLSNEEFNINTISLYPNPTTDVLNIESPQFNIQKIEIFNLNGKRFLSQNFNQQPINLSSLSKGLYLIKIYGEEGISTKKLIKE